MTYGAERFESNVHWQGQSETGTKQIFFNAQWKNDRLESIKLEKKKDFTCGVKTV